MATLVHHRTKTELALQVLREQLRTGQLEPGRRLRLSELTRELGMSPTPIREALRLLQADGLVVYRPHQGIVVAEFSADETAEVVRLRCLLEPLALELTLRSISSGQLKTLERLHAKLLAAVASGHGSATSASNVSWHWAIYDGCGSRHLKEFIRRLWDVYPWRTMWILPGRAEESAREHDAIMEAISGGDGRLAADRLREHIASSQQSLLDRLEREQTGTEGAARATGRAT
jgi:DNA-binding GntR family transcriptional regulator